MQPLYYLSMDVITNLVSELEVDNVEPGLGRFVGNIESAILVVNVLNFFFIITDTIHLRHDRNPSRCKTLSRLKFFILA
jgi:hypothetical protein